MIGSKIHWPQAFLDIDAPMLSRFPRLTWDALPPRRKHPGLLGGLTNSDIEVFGFLWDMVRPLGFSCLHERMLHMIFYKT